MILYIEKETNRFIVDPNFNGPVDSVSFKRGDASTVELRFVTNNTVSTLLSGSSAAKVEFGIKEDGKYDGDFIVFEDAYTISTNNGYVLTPSFNTTTLNSVLCSGDLNPDNDVASVTGMLEVTWSEDDGSTWRSTNTIAAVIDNDVIKGSEGTPVEMDDAEDWLATHGISYSTTITNLTGATSNRLAALPTVDLPLRTIRAVQVSDTYFSFYRLDETDEPSFLPYFVRPNDYDEETNMKTWSMVTGRFDDLYVLGSLIANEFRLQNASGTQILFHNPDSIAGINVSVPNLVGDRKLCLVLDYASDAAATTAGLSAGDIYYNTTRGVFRARA